MSRGTYDNSYNRNRIRIDARDQNDPAVRVGMRNIHRDTDGTVIGGRTAEGQNVGTMSNKNRFRTAMSSNGVEQMGPPKPAQIAQGQTSMVASVKPASMTPRLDAGPQTPRLDAMGADPSAGLSRSARASHFRGVSQKAAMEGKFGSGAQKKAINLEGRQSLFRDMQVVGAGGITDEMKTRAKSLGIDGKQFNNGMSKIKSAPASIARPGSTWSDLSDDGKGYNGSAAFRADLAKRTKSRATEIQNASNNARTPTSAPVGAPPMLAKPAGPPVAPAAPLAGKQKAIADTAKYGATGAAERALAEQARRRANPDAIDKQVRTAMQTRQQLPSTDASLAKTRSRFAFNG